MNFLTTLCSAVLSVGLAAGMASAQPGETSDDSGVEVLDSTQIGCAVKNAMCVTAGRLTVEGAAPQTAGAPPRFSRNLGNEGSDAVPWTLNLAANLRHRALQGNAVFLVYDAENGKDTSNREVVGAWQANVQAGETLAARLTLSPNDGFHPGRTYRIKIVQIVRGREVTLTDGPVWLW